MIKRYVAIVLLLVTALTTAANADFWKSAHACSAASKQIGRFEITAADPCADNRDTHLLYINAYRALYVCENGVTIWANFVSGGKGGFGKQRQGDRKVPSGKYALGAPQISANYGIFIPIAYPNAEDLAAGRNGGSIGIHGPTRRYACDGWANLFTGWTDGCLAYPSDAQVYDLSMWIMQNPKTYIIMRAQ